jgi:hypothetical protein
MDFLALGDCMDASITHMTRQQPPSENLLLEAWQLAHDLKFTHPVARHLRRIRSALCDPYIQALIGTIREKSNTHTPFRSAAVTGLGEGIANLQNHLKNDQITLIDRSCTNLTIESTRNRGLRTVQAEIDDPSPKALRDLKVDLAFCPDLLQGACTGFPAALTNLANVIIPGGWIIITIRRINQFLTPDGVIEEMESGNADLQSSMLKAMLEQSPHFTDVTTMTGPHAGLDDFFLARRAQS